MADMTDEEYDALDELWTRTTPKIDESGSPNNGFFTERSRLREGGERPARAAEADETVQVDRLTIQRLHAKAEATHKTPAEIISEPVRKEPASAS
ncbi:hypothetical protein ACYULU_02750 [Breznakiellaceae bacterium SP9]